MRKEVGGDFLSVMPVTSDILFRRLHSEIPTRDFRDVAHDC